MGLPALHAAKAVSSRVFVFACIIILSACDGHDTVIDCGCQSSTLTSLQAEPGVIVNTLDGYQVLTPAYGYIALCDEVAPSILIDGLNVLISGALKKMCATTGPEAPYAANHLASAVIVPATDSLFSTPPIEIHIIHAEDYGYTPGYGYRMTKTSVDGALRIIQPTIPAVGGNQTFDDPRDAFKVAVFVAYKATQSDLPSVKTFDLQYLLAYP